MASWIFASGKVAMISGLISPFSYIAEEVGDGGVHHLRLHLEMDVERRADDRDVLQQNVVAFDLGNAPGGKADDHHSPGIAERAQRRIEHVAADRIEHRIDARDPR